MDDFKDLCAATGLRQTELAAAMGISTATLSRWLRGETAKRSSVAVDRLRELARAAS